MSDAPYKPANPYVQSDQGEIYRSTGMYVSQQRLIVSLLFVGGGIMMIIISLVVAPMPPSPFDSSPDYSFNNMAALMGLMGIGLGAAIYFLGGLVQDNS